MAGNIEMNSSATRRLISFPELTSLTLDHCLKICRFCQQGPTATTPLAGMDNSKCTPKCNISCCYPTLSSTPSQANLEEESNLGDDSSESTLLFACKCRGPEKYVHSACLELWLQVFQTDRCAICDYKYKISRPFKWKFSWRNIDVCTTLGVVSSFIYRPVLFVVLLIFILKLDELNMHISNGKSVDLIHTSNNIVEPTLFLLIFLITVLVLKMAWSCKTEFLQLLLFHRRFVLEPCDKLQEHERV